MNPLALLRRALRPVPVVPDLEALRLAWELLHDTAPESPEEEAAYRALQKASVQLGRAA